MRELYPGTSDNSRFIKEIDKIFSEEEGGLLPRYKNPFGPTIKKMILSATKPKNECKTCNYKRIYERIKKILSQ